MEKLVIGSFKRKGEKGSFGHHFSHILDDGREVCLESCLHGYCVGIYKDEELISEKTCTNMDNMMETQITPGFSMMLGKALQKAVDIANKILKREG